MSNESRKQFTDMDRDEIKQALENIRQKEMSDRREREQFLRMYPVTNIEIYTLRPGFDTVMYDFGTTVDGQHVYTKKLSKVTNYVVVKDVNGIKGTTVVWPIGIVLGKGRGTK